MTEVPENAPKQDRTNRAEVILTDKGRKFVFHDPKLRPTSITRKVNDNYWEEIASDIRDCFTDQDPFPKGTTLQYKINVTYTIPEQLFFFVQL